MSVVDGLIWGQEAGSSNLLTQTLASIGMFSSCKCLNQSLYKKEVFKVFYLVEESEAHVPILVVFGKPCLNRRNPKNKTEFYLPM